MCPDAYLKAGLEQIRFPPNSGDSNPIETVWARLRKDLAVREQAGEGAHGRSIQASCCSDSSVLLYLEARRDKELLPKAGTRHDEEVAKVSLECLWAVR